MGEIFIVKMFLDVDGVATGWKDFLAFIPKVSDCHLIFCECPGFVRAYVVCSTHSLTGC